jgi:hypothetical protein
VASTGADTGWRGNLGVGIVEKRVVCSDGDGAVEYEDALGEG